MRYSINPAKIVHFTEAGLELIDERSRRFLSWHSHRTTKSRMLALIEDRLSDANIGEWRLLGGLLGVGALVVAEDVSDIPETQSRLLGVLADSCSTPVEAARRLRHACVAILGVGGTGSVVLQQMVAAGVTRYVLVDHDIAEPSNLNRQFLWTRSDFGRPKVELARRYVAERIASHDIRTEQRRISCASGVNEILFASPVDLVVVCLDGPPRIDEVIVRCAAAGGLPVMTGAVGIQRGHFGPLFLPNTELCSRCCFGDRETVASPPQWSSGVTNSIIADLMARECIDFLSKGTCQAVGVRTVVDFTSLETWQAAAACGDPNHE